MRSVVAALVIAASALVWFGAGTPHVSAAPSAQSILARMVAARDGLNSFSVPIHFDIQVHELINVSLGLDGARYFERPDREALIMNSVPALAKDFQRLYPSLGTPETWPEQYNITLVPPNQTPGLSNYELRGVPKKAGNVAYVLLDVTRDTAAPVRSRWFYRNGATIVMDIQNGLIKKRYWLPATETLDITFPQYKAHAVAHYGDYSINQPIPDSVWQASPQPSPSSG